MYNSTRVKMPDGSIRVAEVTSGTRNGYRSARIIIDGVKVRGRVSARHGFTDGRTLKFEVLAEDAVFYYPSKTFVTAS